MAYVEPPTRSSSEFIDKDDWNADVRDTREFCHKPPSARGYRSSVQTLTTSTFTDVAFDNESHDTDTLHDTSTNNSRFTCKTAGVYLVTGIARFEISGTGGRWLAINVNGSNKYANFRDAISTAHDLSISGCVKLAVNDYVELEAWQSSGGDLDVTVPTAFQPSLTITFVGSGS